MDFDRNSTGAVHVAARTCPFLWRPGAGAQLGALAVVGVWTVVLTLVIARLVALVVPMRVDAEAETNGLDLSAHGERGYELNS